MKTFYKILLLITISYLVFSLSYYNENVRVVSAVLFVAISLISLLVGVIFLCRKKNRHKVKYTLFVILSCILCVFISKYAYVSSDPTKKAERQVAKFIKEYNSSHSGKTLKLVSFSQDTIQGKSYIAEAKLEYQTTDALDTEVYANIVDHNNIILYVSVSGKANETCIIESAGLNNYGFTEDEIKILELGGYFSHNRVTDGKLCEAEFDNRGKYNVYFEGLRNLTAYNINESLDIKKSGYYYGSELHIDLTFKNPDITLTNPYILVRLNDDDNNTITFSTTAVIRKHMNDDIHLNLGAVDAEKFNIFILPKEVLSDNWLTNYLLTKYNWKGKEFTSLYVGGAFEGSEWFKVCNYISKFKI